MVKILTERQLHSVDQRAAVWPILHVILVHIYEVALPGACCALRVAIAWGISLKFE